MKHKSFFPILFLLLLVTAIISLTLGKYPVPLQDTARYFLFRIFGVGNISPEYYQILGNLLVDIRMPRILAAIL
ncbi:MAG TPA: ABC transporter permease, partial [Syntrophorhabdus aromaticivorans]|nr:ABC transporter permease [Syntrophorhabdus aromaticivorans]